MSHAHYVQLLRMSRESQTKIFDSSRTLEAENEAIGGRISYIQISFQYVAMRRCAYIARS